MTTLYDPMSYDSIDRSGMREHLRDLPAQCGRAWIQANSFVPSVHYSQIDKVVVLGMGGSAIGGDLVRALIAPKSSVAFVSHRDYGLPAFVDKRTLIIASSYSGDTEETLDGFSMALDNRCGKIVITTGGKLKTIADEHGIPAFVYDHRSPPRAALGYSLMPILAILQKLALIPNISSEVEHALSSMETICSKNDTMVPDPENAAKTLAARLHNHIPVIYGSGELAPVAYRWKTQFNENSKTWAVSESIPELCHNSVAGLDLPDFLKQRACVLMLQSHTSHVRNRARFEAVEELLATSKVSHQRVWAHGDSSLAQVLSMIMLGDWTSYYLAILNGVDPTPIPSIDYLKSRLNQG